MRTSNMIKLGKISFANCDFPYYGLEYGKIPLKEVSITEAYPPILAKKILNRELDISPISSIMYARLNNLLILPDISITSNDFTKSVLICADSACKCELQDFEGKTLCIPETTASSAALIRIILKHKGINCKFIGCKASNISKMLELGDAALLIGDDALYAARSDKYNVIADLGNEWKKMTGKKMVYALWVVREDYAKKYPDKVEYILDSLLKSKDYGHTHFDEIADFIGKKMQIESVFIRDYLSTLNYDFDEESIESLMLFFKYAKEYGILSSSNEMRFFER